MHCIQNILCMVTASALTFSMSTSAAVPYLNLSKELVFMLSGGMGWTGLSQSQFVFLTPDAANYYNDQTNNQSIFLGELFVGLNKTWHTHLKSQWGLLLGGSGAAKMNGEIWQYADSEFNNMTYNYKVRLSRVGLRGKLIAEQAFFLNPYLTASLGTSFNRAYAFHNYANESFVIANPDFLKHTSTSFSYSLGLGLQKELSKQFQIGVGYEFFDWGKSQLGAAQGQSIGSGLGMNHINTHALLFNVSFTPV